MTGCPHWCARHASAICVGEPHQHGGVCLWLLQEPGAAAKILIDGQLVPARDAAGWARTFARLGAAELAATVRRLGELADAETITVTPDPQVRAAVLAAAGLDDKLREGGVARGDDGDHAALPAHHECTVGEQPGVVVNPATHKLTVVTS